MRRFVLDKRAGLRLSQIGILPCAEFSSSDRLFSWVFQTHERPPRLKNAFHPQNSQESCSKTRAPDA